MEHQVKINVLKGNQWKKDKSPIPHPLKERDRLRADT